MDYRNLNDLELVFLYICGGLKINVMAEQIIGRLAEKNILKECYESD